MKHKLSLFGITLLLTGIVAAVFLIMGKSPAFGATSTNAHELGCTTIRISPESNTSYINANSIISAETGEIFYLIPSSDHMASELIYVQPDKTVTNLGTLPIAEGVYSFPRWQLYPDTHSILYLTMELSSAAPIFGLESIDYTTGDITTIATEVNEFGFGKIEHLIWWGNTQGETLIYNPETTLSTLVAFATKLEIFFPARPLRLLPNNEILFELPYMDESDSRGKVQYWRANLDTGESWPLHEDEMAINQFSNIESLLVLENSILYINSEGILKEMDFEGNLMRTVALQGPGYYRDLLNTNAGIAYTYHLFQNSNFISNSLYFVTQTGIVTELTPAGVNFGGLPIDIATHINSSGQEQLWVALDHPTDSDKGTLLAYALLPDAEPRQIFSMNDIGDFELSPNGKYIVASQAREGVLISTDTLNEEIRIGDYYGRYRFSGSEDSIFFTRENTVYAYDFTTDQQIPIFTTERENPAAFFVDNENGLVYIFDSDPVGNNEVFGRRHVNVTTFDGASTAVVSLPEVQIPFDTHSRGFLNTNAGDMLYFGEDWQSLYLAQCE